MSDDERVQRIRASLGDELVQLLDRRERAWRELEAASADIYAALVNRVQSQSAVALIHPYEQVTDQLATHEQRLELKRTKIADLRMIIEDQERRLKAIEERLDGDGT